MSTTCTLFLPGHFDVETAVGFFGGDRDGLTIWGEAGNGDSSEEYAELLESLVGYRREIYVTFQFTKMAPTYQRNFLDMVATTIAFFAAHPDVPGYLAFNGETLLLQRLPGGELLLDASWREFADDEDDPELDTIAASCQTRRLPQPFM